MNYVINKDSTPETMEAYSRLYVRAIYWSDEDNCFIGSLPELCGPCCHGQTSAEVSRQLDEIALGYVADKATGEFIVPDPGNLRFVTQSRFSISKNAGSDIARLRRKLALSQDDFAKALGVSLSTVGLWEQGRRKPDGASRRLLSIAEKHPEVLLEKV